MTREKRRERREKRREMQGRFVKRLLEKKHDRF
jgi:hypothetical protein